MKSVDLSQINIDKIKSKISGDSSDMSFVIRNGIHRYNNNKNWSLEYWLIFWGMEMNMKKLKRFLMVYRLQNFMI